MRKLVLETAKFNVLTAHSTREAIDLFHLFPNVCSAILACGDKINCATVAEAIKSITQKVPVIVLLPHVAPHSPIADHSVSSHEPEKLLELVRSLFGDPREHDGE